MELLLICQTHSAKGRLLHGTKVVMSDSKSSPRRERFFFFNFTTLRQVEKERKLSLESSARLWSVDCSESGSCEVSGQCRCAVIGYKE